MKNSAFTQPSLPIALLIRAFGSALIVFLASMSGSASGATCSPVTSGYTVDSKVTFFLKDSAQNPPQLLERRVDPADPGSFELLHLPQSERGPCGGRRVEYARDKSHVYYRWRVIQGADPKTYAFMDENYARDKQAVYSGARRLTSRVKQFQTLGTYATDGRRHFYRDIVITGKGFKLLGGEAHAARGYALTDFKVFYKGKVIRRADPKSFDLLKPEVGIARDKRFVFYDGQVVPGADPVTIEQVNGYTFKDKLAVYTKGQRVTGVEASTVRATEFGGYLIDKSAVFKQGKPLASRDPSTFVELQSPWTKDKNLVYYKDEPVPHIDSHSFKTTSLDRGEDESYRYEGLIKVCKFRANDSQDLPICP